MPPTPEHSLETLRGVLADFLELDPCRTLAQLLPPPDPAARPSGGARDDAPFSEHDLKDFPGWVQRLNGRADPISSFLGDQLKPATRTELASPDLFSAEADAARKRIEIQRRLLEDLNSVVAGTLIWHEPRFTNTRLRPKTQALLKPAPIDTRSARINKRLIEDAYPFELRRNDFQRFLLRDPSQPLVLRVAERLDVTADAVVVDHELGTFALIHLVDITAPKSLKPLSREHRQHVRQQLGQRIGEAAYLRHLFLEDLRPGETQWNRAPFAVEVVFMLSEPAATRWLIEELRAVTRDVSLLHAIGVSLLAPPVPKTPPPTPATSHADLYSASDIHRAFSWLLCRTREWMVSQLPDRASPAAPPPIATPAASATTPAEDVRRMGPPSMLLLKHFRLRGSRRWSFAPNRGLHLVHGHNGSGKSSFVEAIELVTTGRIEKLRNADYPTVLTNRTILGKRRDPGPVPRAVVILRWLVPTSSKEPIQAGSTASAAANPATPRWLAWRLTSTGVDQALASQRFPRPGAFRLNQDVIQLLARASDKAQAKILLETFFPEGFALVTESQRALRRRDETLAKLPARLRRQFENDTGAYSEPNAAETLKWVKPSGIPWDRLIALLPFDSSQLSALRALLPLTIESHLQRTGTAPSWEPVLEAAKDIDHSLATLLNQSTRLLSRLQVAQAFLNAYQDVAAATPEASDTQLSDLLGHWLQRLAATDILKREHDLLAAIETLDPKAPSSNLDAFPPNMTPALAAVTHPESRPKAPERLQRLEQFQSELQIALDRVSAFASSTDRQRQEGASAPPLHHFDLSALDDLAAAGVLGREFVTTTPKLSEAVRTAFQTGKPVPIRQADRTLIQIGASGAFRALASRLESAATALNALESARAELASPQGGLVNTLQQFQTLQQIASQQQEALTVAARRFRERLQTPLGDALNEFTSMLTPARWAYDDIVSRIDDKDSSPSLDFVQDGQPAPLRLNTAQLSAFALAFFLLCNRAREHPLRLGILDDPFENMDELTVTTVARGLGRFLRLRRGLGDGPESWQLLLFLHGEQNVERVRREIPCATYFLPWLSPGAELGKEPVIQSEKSQIVGDTLQDLSRILTDTRSRVASTARPLAT